MVAHKFLIKDIQQLLGPSVLPHHKHAKDQGHHEHCGNDSKHDSNNSTNWEGTIQISIRGERLGSDRGPMGLVIGCPPSSINVEVVGGPSSQSGNGHIGSDKVRVENRGGGISLATGSSRCVLNAMPLGPRISIPVDLYFSVGEESHSEAGRNWDVGAEGKESSGCLKPSRISAEEQHRHCFVNRELH